MNSLLSEINSIDKFHNSSDYKNILNLIHLGELASSGDPSFIFSFCHEFYFFIVSLKNNSPFFHHIYNYNSGMSLSSAEYYYTSAFRSLIYIKNNYHLFFST